MDIYQENYSTTGIFWSIRIFLAKLLIGKKSAVINCKLNNCRAIVRVNSILINNIFDNRSRPDKKEEGITIFPFKK